MTETPPVTPESIARAKTWRDAERREIERAAGVTIRDDGHVWLAPQRGFIEIVCGWCGLAMGTRDGKGTVGISHSLCPDCDARLRATEGP